MIACPRSFYALSFLAVEQCRRCRRLPKAQCLIYLRYLSQGAKMRSSERCNPNVHVYSFKSTMVKFIVESSKVFVAFSTGISLASFWTL